MLSAAGIQSLESRISAGVIEARQPHVLQRVSVFTTTLCRVRQGEKVLHWDGREMRAGAQQLVLLPAGRALSVTNIPSSQGHYLADAISFPASLLRDFNARYRRQLPPANSVSSDLCVPLSKHTAQAWEHLLLAVRSDTPDTLLNHYAETVLLSLGLDGHAGPLLMDRHDPLCERLQQLILSDPSGDWTVATAAQKLNLGASTLRRQLSDEGHSFRQILEDVRLGKALERLQTTGHSIGEIAACSGYASASRFAVRFRERYGLSPRELRAAL
jgi:AraC-like DNA-binding protein